MPKNIHHPYFFLKFILFHGLVFIFAQLCMYLMWFTSNLAPNLKLNEVYSISIKIMQTITLKYLLRYGGGYMKIPTPYMLYS